MSRNKQKGIFLKQNRGEDNEKSLSFQKGHDNSQVMKEWDRLDPTS